MDWKRGLGKGGNYYQVTTLGGKFDCYVALLYDFREGKCSLF